MKTHHPVARLESLYAAPNFHDCSRKLVPQNLRRRDKTVMNFLDVRSANAASRHAKEKLALANLGDRHRLNNHAPLTTVHTRAHLPRVVALRFVRADLCRLAHIATASAFAVSRCIAGIARTKSFRTFAKLPAALSPS